MKSPSIVKFDYLYLGGVIVSLLAMIAGWDLYMIDLVTTLAQEDVDPILHNLILDAVPWTFGFVFVFLAVLWVAISVWKWGFVRYVLGLILALGLLGLVGETMSGQTHPFLLVSSWIATVMTIVALFFAFQPDANAWLREEY